MTEPIPACEHNWLPVERMRAVYRCPNCRIMGYKHSARIGFGESNIVPYVCTKCDNPATKLYTDPLGYKRAIKPLCDLHRPDKQIG